MSPRLKSPAAPEAIEPATAGTCLRPAPRHIQHDFRYAAERLTRLVFFHVTEFTGEVRNLEFADIVWTRREKLPEYDFLEGDVEFVRRLAKRS